MTDKQADEARAKVRAKANDVFSASQQRDETVKGEIAKEKAKVAAKTAKLRALRLAKEAADRETGVSAVGDAPKKKIRKRSPKSGNASL